ncbi:NAD(P)-binding protein [Hypoxylon sp. FL1284]|nr:NAD(P)-binding protein [Hypoxylon sp. FL1284]
MTTPESYEAAFADGAVTAVVHAASPLVVSPKDSVRELLEPAVRGSTAILNAIQRYGGGRVKRVVATSSFAAIIDVAQGKRPGYTYDEKDWNPATWDEAAASRGPFAYCASKALAERAMWDWLKAARDSGGSAGLFSLTTVCPAWVFGPYAAQPRATRAGLSESVQLLDNIIGAAAVPPFDFGGYADVREVAAAHVRALETPDAAGRRFLLAQDFRYQAAVDAARERLPQMRDRLPVGNPGDWEEAYHVDGSLATRVLGLRYGTLADTVVDTYVQLLKAKEIEGAA